MTEGKAMVSLYMYIYIDVWTEDDAKRGREEVRVCRLSTW